MKKLYCKSNDKKPIIVKFDAIKLKCYSQLISDLIVEFPEKGQTIDNPFNIYLNFDQLIMFKKLINYFDCGDQFIGDKKYIRDNHKIIFDYMGVSSLNSDRLIECIKEYNIECKIQSICGDINYDLNYEIKDICKCISCKEPAPIFLIEFRFDDGSAFRIFISSTSKITFNKFSTYICFIDFNKAFTTKIYFKTDRIKISIDCEDIPDDDWVINVSIKYKKNLINIINNIILLCELYHK